jgi:phytoene desaturase
MMLEELWALAGKRLSDDIDMRPVTPFYRIRFHDGTSFDYTGDPEAMRSEVARFSPEDVEGYEQFIIASERIFKVGFEELAHVPFGSVWEMAKIVPQMMKLESYRSVYGLVAKYLKNDKLRQIMSFHPLLVGGNPFSTTSIYTLIAFLERKWGVHFPIGGTGALVQGLVKLIEGQGSTVRCNAEVEQILLHGRKARGVRLKNGEQIDADIVVSNGDSAWTYRHLVDPSVRHRWTNEKLEKQRYSMGLFVWYFGTNRKYPDIAHHTILLGPRYEGLLEDIFTRHVLADDFSLYLHRPTATDTALAPDGGEAFYVLSPVPNLSGTTDWNKEAEPYRKRIEEYLSSTIMPGLDKSLVVSRVTHPLEFQDRLLSFRGAAFGMEPVLTQSAFFRPHNKSEDVEGLFIVGAGTHPGAGLPGVLSSARVLDTVVPHASELR